MSGQQLRLVYGVNGTIQTYVYGFLRLTNVDDFYIDKGIVL